MRGSLESLTYGKRASPYEDWLRRGRPEDTCFTYGTHSLETSDHFALIPHMNMFYMYVDMDWVAIEAAVGFRTDLGNRTIMLTSAVCETRNIWPEMMRHLNFRPGKTNGGITLFKHAMSNARNMGLYEVMRYLFGPRWKHAYGRPGFLPSSMLVVGREWEEKVRTCWNVVEGRYDTTRTVAATRIQAAYRGWRVRMLYRFSPHNCLGRHVIRRMMMLTH